MSRVHIALTVSDLERSVAFYRSLFSAEPSKQRSDYAKFELEEPAIHLALNEDPDGVREPSKHGHFGIQVENSGSVWAERQRLEKAGVETWEEEAVACCYSVQDKIWARDPDGHPWEIFVVKQPNTEENQSSEPTACCV